MASGGARPGSGRKKGITSTIIEDVRQKISDAGLVEFLIDAAKGKFVDGQYLTYKERCDVAQYLLNKTVPNLKSVEHNGSGENNEIVIKLLDMSK